MWEWGLWTKNGASNKSVSFFLQIGERGKRESVLCQQRPLYPTLYPRPFGIILGYQLSNNSLESLKNNWQEQCFKVHDVNYFCNIVCVLGEGLLRHENFNLTKGEKHLLIDTDEFVNLVLTTHKRINNSEPNDEIILRIITEGAKDKTFGRLFTYLLIMLTRMKLNVPDIGRYIDPDLPIAIIKE